MIPPIEKLKLLLQAVQWSLQSRMLMMKEQEEKEDKVLGKFQVLKRFDTVDDFSDHHFNRLGLPGSGEQPPKTWSKRIQEEWKILEKDLPDTIYVRVYETRMDLLRALIVGPAGTPYHDGLFVFDVLFPPTYPDIPPMVYYYSGGLRLNPNLYNCGKVCLSLLNTWSGSKNEMWMPKKSTMLQVLVSIQALILNAEPFFNEPGFAGMQGKPEGEMRSKAYNEDVFILSLKTMMYTLRRPPKHFENLVADYFRLRAHDILSACKAYMEGAEIGSVVNGRVQDTNKANR
ncbi:putative ubiquitin-conjugating enzyme E2 38 [Actinidia eriantha]|uniref:putative ubiquitin-conjugating enzyme E2 38 n=1 Tax=Actinidia eriantha TaxID=165200 RepID=UPI002589A1B4|nr:putative ubiquitin-conjugating enzyme E2 38 [Actinidia eriantha]